MSKKLKIALAQLNLTVGDIQGNLKKLIDASNHARDHLKADVIVFPELSITGYPPEDLLFRKTFLDEANEALNKFKSEVQNIHCVVGHPYLNSQRLFNSCSLIYNGTILARYSKQHLPNYGVFDEDRYFKSGDSSSVVPINGIPVGIVICEDLWEPGPVHQSAFHGARVILSPNASPFEINKHEQRHLILSKRAKDSNVPIVYVNCVGGQDELIFDGDSMVIDQTGKICQQVGIFNEKIFLSEIEFTSTETKIESLESPSPSDEEKIYNALVLGVRDYIEKNHFPGVIIGLSGGIDSALVLAIAVDALGKDRVAAYLLPSRYTSDISNEDALTLIKNLNVEHDIISIEPTFKSFIESLSPVFAGKKPDVTEENLQSRCRGVILMAISNKTGRLILTTGNRSEVAVGYATLYGDMAGGLDVLKDVPKTMVYRLANYRNQLDAIIPQRIIDRPPTAELAVNQKDEDTLPPYPTLDKILELYLNQQLGIEDIVAQGFDKDVVTKVVRMIHLSEYKRRQAPIGIRINHTAFGRDRRYPITSGYKG